MLRTAGGYRSPDTAAASVVVRVCGALVFGREGVRCPVRNVHKVRPTSRATRSGTCRGRELVRNFASHGGEVELGRINCDEHASRNLRQIVRGPIDHEGSIRSSGTQAQARDTYKITIPLAGINPGNWDRANCRRRAARAVDQALSTSSVVRPLPRATEFYNVSLHGFEPYR